MDLSSRAADVLQYGGAGMWKLLLVLLVSLAASAQEVHPTLALGSAAPDFSLPGVDGKTHSLSEYASSPILVVSVTIAQSRRCMSSASSSLQRTTRNAERLSSRSNRMILEQSGSMSWTRPISATAWPR